MPRRNQTLKRPITFNRCVAILSTKNIAANVFIQAIQDLKYIFDNNLQYSYYASDCRLPTRSNDLQIAFPWKRSNYGSQF